MFRFLRRNGNGASTSSSNGGATAGDSRIKRQPGANGVSQTGVSPNGASRNGTSGSGSAALRGQQRSSSQQVQRELAAASK